MWRGASARDFWNSRAQYGSCLARTLLEITWSCSRKDVALAFGGGNHVDTIGVGMFLFGAFCWFWHVQRTAFFLSLMHEIRECEASSEKVSMIITWRSVSLPPYSDCGTKLQTRINQQQFRIIVWKWPFAKAKHVQTSQKKCDLHKHAIVHTWLSSSFALSLAVWTFSFYGFKVVNPKAKGLGWSLWVHQAAQGPDISPSLGSRRSRTNFWATAVQRSAERWPQSLIQKKSFGDNNCRSADCIGFDTCDLQLRNVHQPCATKAVQGFLERSPIWWGHRSLRWLKTPNKSSSYCKPMISKLSKHS